MPHYRISNAAELLGVSGDTVRRWIARGQLAAVSGPSGRKTIEGTELAEFARSRSADFPQPQGPSSFPQPQGPSSSARNRFVGLVTKVISDPVMSQVELQCGPYRLSSLMSTEAAEELNLAVGMVATASVKATQVVVETGGFRER